MRESHPCRTKPGRRLAKITSRRPLAVLTRQVDRWLGALLEHTLFPGVVIPPIGRQIYIGYARGVKISKLWNFNSGPPDPKIRTPKGGGKVADPSRHNWGHFVREWQAYEHGHFSTVIFLGHVSTSSLSFVEHPTIPVHAKHRTNTEWISERPWKHCEAC